MNIVSEVIKIDCQALNLFLSFIKFTYSYISTTVLHVFKYSSRRYSLCDLSYFFKKIHRIYKVIDHFRNVSIYTYRISTMMSEFNAHQQKNISYWCLPIMEMMYTNDGDGVCTHYSVMI